MRTSQFLYFSLAALQLVKAEDVTSALHSITDKCTSKEGYDACHSFATEQLATCSPNDLNCHCAKIAAIQDYCRDSCQTSDYISDATRVFLEETCKVDSSTKQTRSEDTDAILSKGSDIAKNLGLDKLGENLKSGIQMASTQVQARMNATLGHNSSEPQLEKKSTDQFTGMNKDLHLRYRQPDADENEEMPYNYYFFKMPDEYRQIVESVLKDYESRFSYKYPSRVVSGHGDDLMRVNKPGPELEIDEYCDSYGNDIYRVEEDYNAVTMFRDATVTPVAAPTLEVTITVSEVPETKVETSASTSTNKTDIFGKLKSKLNINAVMNATTVPTPVRTTSQNGTVTTSPTGSTRRTPTTPIELPKPTSPTQPMMANSAPHSQSSYALMALCIAGTVFFF